MTIKILAALILIFASPVYAYDWVSELNIADDPDVKQIVTIKGTKGSEAEFTLHEKDSGGWYEVLTCKAYIGKNGWGKAREGDNKTPKGMFSFTKAFGIEDDPGSVMYYTKVDDSHYWVGDSQSEYYNQFVSTLDIDNFSKKDSEHIIDYKQAYKYCLNISYNEDGVPHLGSAIFLHCQTNNKFTNGCVAIPEKDMIKVLKHVNDTCVVIMDTAKDIMNY